MSGKRSELNPMAQGETRTKQADRDQNPRRDDDHDKAFASNQKEMLKSGQMKPPTPAGKARGQKG